MLAAILRASSRVSSLAAASSQYTKASTYVPHDKAGVQFLDSPRRREAAFGHNRLTESSANSQSRGALAGRHSGLLGLLGLPRSRQPHNAATSSKFP
jgi:hypothetical protein